MFLPSNSAVCLPVWPRRYISLLRLLRLGRAYRLVNWVRFLTYNQTLSLMVVTLVRNFLVGRGNRPRAQGGGVGGGLLVGGAMVVSVWVALAIVGTRLLSCRHFCFACSPISESRQQMRCAMLNELHPAPCLSLHLLPCTCPYFCSLGVCVHGQFASRIISISDSLSLLLTMSCPPVQIVFFVVHWAACLFYYIAKQHGFDQSSWVGEADIPNFSDKAAIEK
jgi:hypothetical protein